MQNGARLAMKYELIVFDMDGTLTFDALDFDTLRKELGLQVRHPILECIDTLGPNERQQAWETLHRHEAVAAEKCQLRPGAEQVLERLRRRGLKTALLSRNSQRSVETVLRRYPIFFDHIASRDQAPIKPAGESLLRICRALRISAEKTLMVGDYVFDLQVATNAGTHSVLLVEPESTLPYFAQQATYLIRKLEDIGLLVAAPEEFLNTTTLAEATKR